MLNTVMTLFEFDELLHRLQLPASIAMREKHTKNARDLEMESLKI